MPKPYGGPDIKNEAQYEAASLEGRILWHRKQARGYDTRLNALRTQYTVDLTDVENPIYQEMKYYQDKRNFHDRQVGRLKKCIRLGKTECNDYYSEELEGENRQQYKNQTTPTGKKDPYVELSLEAYNDLTNHQKMKYHAGMAQQKDREFHSRMYNRLREKRQLPTFPSPKYGGESAYGKEYTKEEYLSMDKDSKRKYHGAMWQRFMKINDTELEGFHRRMYNRLYKNSNLPTFFSPEHQQEEE